MLHDDNATMSSPLQNFGTSKAFLWFLSSLNRQTLVSLIFSFLRNWKIWYEDYSGWILSALLPKVENTSPTVCSLPREILWFRWLKKLKYLINKEPHSFSVTRHISKRILDLFLCCLCLCYEIFYFSLQFCFVQILFFLHQQKSKLFRLT